MRGKETIFAQYDTAVSFLLSRIKNISAKLFKAPANDNYAMPAAVAA